MRETVIGPYSMLEALKLVPFGPSPEFLTAFLLRALIAPPLRHKSMKRQIAVSELSNSSRKAKYIRNFNSRFF